MERDMRKPGKTKSECLRKSKNQNAKGLAVLKAAVSIVAGARDFHAPVARQDGRTGYSDVGERLRVAGAVEWDLIRHGG
jgi:hypothetical protein